jgi:hypothetical protein
LDPVSVVQQYQEGLSQYDAKPKYDIPNVVVLLPRFCDKNQGNLKNVSFSEEKPRCLIKRKEKVTNSRTCASIPKKAHPLIFPKGTAKRYYKSYYSKFLNLVPREKQQTLKSKLKG